MKNNFYKFLENYRNENFSSFHTPGHKNNFFDNNLISLDFTELPCTDSLYESSGIIKNLENQISKIYDTDSSFISCGGNTLCIQAMIRLSAKSGDKILCDNIIHRSAISAMALLNITPVWLERKICKNSGLATEINLEDLENKINTNNIKAVYLTSPSYHGILQDIKQISEICKKHKILLIIDNAHGSHLKFLGIHPIDLGADITADSAHKTLPVLTGGAWLHINKQIYNKNLTNQAKSAMALFGSTSPSYITMSSMSLCANWLENDNINQKFKELTQKVEYINSLARKKNIFVLNDHVKTDPTRIAFGAFSIGYTGFELGEKMREHKIEPELCDENYVVLIPSPLNSNLDWERLENFINKIETKNKFKPNINNTKNDYKTEISLTQALLSESEEIHVMDSLNRISSDIISPCPPGVPIVIPGQKINKPIINNLLTINISKINVLK